MANSRRAHDVMLLFATMVIGFMPASPARPNNAMIGSSIIVKASPNLVWKAIRDPSLRKCFHRKVVSTCDNMVIVEDRFDGLPLLGCATCLFNERESPGERVEFSLLKSDKLKEFEGRWILTPINGGRETNLQLNAFCDSGVNLPFAHYLTNTTVHKFIDMELAEAKETAESLQEHDISGNKDNRQVQGLCVRDR